MTKLPSSVDKKFRLRWPDLSNLERVATLHIRDGCGDGQHGPSLHPAAGKKNRSSSSSRPRRHLQRRCEPRRHRLRLGANDQQPAHRGLFGHCDVHARLSSSGGRLHHRPQGDRGDSDYGKRNQILLEPVATVLNYLETQSHAGSFPAIRDISMVGLSGGGWTTTVYAALDPRIKVRCR